MTDDELVEAVNNYVNNDAELQAAMDAFVESLAAITMTAYITSTRDHALTQMLSVYTLRQAIKHIEQASGAQ